MADFDSADLLSRLKVALQVSTNTLDLDDSALYVLLSNAQRAIMTTLAAHVPHTQYGAPLALTSADSGITYTFTTYPMGKIELYDGVDGPTLRPVPYWAWATDGFVMEGQTIRFPGNRARTFANGLYARYIPRPTAISAAVEPVLRPDYIREAIVWEAARQYATQGGAMDPEPYRTELNRILWGDPEVPGQVGFIPSAKVQYAGQGATGNPAASAGGRWWLSSDFLQQ